MILLVLAVYGTSTILLRGKLPNQTATIATTQGSEIQSLIPNQNITYVSLPIDSNTWTVSYYLSNYQKREETKAIYVGLNETEVIYARTVYIERKVTIYIVESDGTRTPTITTVYEPTKVEKFNKTSPHEKLIIKGTLSYLSKHPAYLKGTEFRIWYFQRVHHLGYRFPPLFTATFNATLLERRINFSETPYLHAHVSSTADVILNLYVGWRYLSNPERGVYWTRERYIIDPERGENIYGHSLITIDMAKKLSELKFEDKIFEGLQIRAKLIGYKLEPNFSYETTIESMYLTNELLYQLGPSGGNGSPLSDGSVTYIIRNETIACALNSTTDWHLQRAHILYSMDAPKETLYTIFLLSKHDENITSVRIGYVFVHKILANEISTYIDWRRPLQLNCHFEPVATLHNLMDNGDYAVIFTPLEGNKLQSVQLHKVEFTFSKLPYSAFVITSFDEKVLLIMSAFIITIAGVLPAVLLFVLLYMHKKNRLKDDKITIIKIIVIGLALRLILAPITAYADDIQIFAEVGALYFGSGVFGAQWVSLPGFVYLETAAYSPYALLRAVGFQDFQFLALAIYSVEALFTKIPSILGDLGSFYFIMRIAKKTSPRNRTLLPALYFLNPLTIYVSGILGQFDSIFTFAVIASIYYLVAEYNTIKATISSSFAAILNPVGIATLIPLLANVSLRESRRAMVKCLLLATGIFGVSILPFVFQASSPLLLASYERVIGGIPGEPIYGKQISFYAYGTYIPSSVGYGLTFRFLIEIMGYELGPIFYPYGAALIFLIFLAVFIYKTHKAYMRGSYGLIYTGTFMLGVACLFQLTFPTIFDQFVVWIAGLLLVSYALYQDRRFLLIFTLICISTGFIYICIWRDYLLLSSGVEKSPFANPLIANLASASIGVLYSTVLLIILVITLKMWMPRPFERMVDFWRSKIWNRRH